MSLIKEALHKPKPDGEKKSPPPPPASPPPPSPAAAADKPPDSFISAKGMQLAVLGVIVISLGIVCLSFFKGKKPATPPPPPATVAPAAAVHGVVAAPASNRAVAAHASSTTSAASPDGRAATSAVARATPAIVRPAAAWPKLNVKGRFTMNGKLAVVFGDGTILRAGATAPSGVTLLDADADAARLQYEYETRVYKYNGAFTTVTNDAEP